MVDVASLHLPSAEVLAEYRAAGWWRDETFLDDLADAARTRPAHPAMIAYRDDTVRTVTYGEFPSLVERFAAGLSALGVGRGDVVVLYLPNLWQLPVLVYACARIGAVCGILNPFFAQRELAFNLEMSKAAVCITVDEFNSADFGKRLEQAAPETLRHRVVIGDAAATGAVDFTEFFLDTTHPAPDPALALGPDDPAVMVCTSGTSGRMKGAIHSHNTLYAAIRSVSEPCGLGADDVIAVPHPHAFMAGLTYGVLMPLHLGGTCLADLQHTDMARLLDMIERHRVSWAYMSPAYLVDLLAANRAKPHDTGSLARIVTGSAPIQPELVAAAREVLGVPLHALWGMTENGAVTMTRPDDPDDWATSSDGRGEPWMEVRIDLDDDPSAGRLLVRGASQCFGYLGQYETYAACLDDDGWFDTGDMARPDGRDGIRIVGRRDDMIVRATGFKVPVLEVEGLLLKHPDIAELALVGYPDPAVPGVELCCAVVVPTDQPPSLEAIHEFLAATGITRLSCPDRVQYVRELPRNSVGKILRAPLRKRLELAAAPR
ncbi:AMP-binding protein [Streptomyces odontomachi]|uniref:AMP-binding protein n=1 Tax=Streptomyces odontomachi TaxID=2944940 RepID=UPI0021090A58|nr:AMP-binding protein [Streptomyces sp. ODS25]